MNKETMIKNYRRFSAADSYVLGFIYRHEVYIIEVKEIMPRFMKVEHESSKKGGNAKLQLRLTNKDMEYLIRKGAYSIGTEEILAGKYNKGVEFEREVASHYDIIWRGKDNLPFYTSGDINVRGREIQVKFNGAQIVVETTLKRLVKETRNK